MRERSFFAWSCSRGLLSSCLLSLWCMASLLASAGCSLKEPPSPWEIRRQAGLALPAEWQAGGESGPVADNWLAAFDDDNLAMLVAEAVTRNPDLRVSAVKVEQAAEYVNLAKANLLPAVNIVGTGGTKSGGGDATSALQGIALVASWELDLWGRLRYGRQAAAESYRSARADLEFARQSIAAATAKSWFLATETWLQRQIAGEMVQSAELLLALTEKRYDVGVIGQDDVALAQASLGTLRDKVVQVDLAHGQAIRALELLIGRYPAAELKASRELAKLSGPVPAGIPLELLERRPDLIAAERRVAAAFNRVGEAKAARLPKITLNASVAAFTSEVIRLKDDFSNPVSGAGARLLAPVYQGGALQTQVEIRTLEQKEAVAQYGAMALRALGDVENALAAIENLAERERLLQQNVKDQQRAYELIQTGYRTGTVDLRSVQQQLLDLHAARLSLLRVQSEQLSQRINLHLALGGSFERVVENENVGVTGAGSELPTSLASGSGEGLSSWQNQRLKETLGRPPASAACSTGHRRPSADGSEAEDPKIEQIICSCQVSLWQDEHFPVVGIDPADDDLTANSLEIFREFILRSSDCSIVHT